MVKWLEDLRSLGETSRLVIFTDPEELRRSNRSSLVMLAASLDVIVSSFTANLSIYGWKELVWTDTIVSCGQG